MMLPIRKVVVASVFLLLVGICTVLPAQLPKSEFPTTERIREAIGRSLPYLETAGLSWMNEKKCVSCHRVSFLTWTFNAAAERGFEFERKKLGEWVDWSVVKSLTAAAEGKPVDGELNVDGLSQLILGHPVGSPQSLPRDAALDFVKLILKTQQEDGSWKPAGQLPFQKRPEIETSQVSTMWNVIALRRVGGDADSVEQACLRALAWLENAEPGKSTEWYASRLLLVHYENAEEKRKGAIRELLSLQRDDGGWGWLTDDASDALATGQAIYVLSATGFSADDRAMQRAKQFLVSTQLDDGSWKVHGTKEKKKGGVEETATYWGTAWATIGLLSVIPQPEGRP